MAMMTIADMLRRARGDAASFNGDPSSLIQGSTPAAGNYGGDPSAFIQGSQGTQYNSPAYNAPSYGGPDPRVATGGVDPRPNGYGGPAVSTQEPIPNQSGPNASSMPGAYGATPGTSATPAGGANIFGSQMYGTPIANNGGGGAPVANTAPGNMANQFGAFRFNNPSDPLQSNYNALASRSTQAAGAYMNANRTALGGAMGNQAGNDFAQSAINTFGGGTNSGGPGLGYSGGGMGVGGEFSTGLSDADAAALGARKNSMSNLYSVPLANANTDPYGLAGTRIGQLMQQNSGAINRASGGALGAPVAQAGGATSGAAGGANASPVGTMGDGGAMGGGMAYGGSGPSLVPPWSSGPTPNAGQPSAANAPKGIGDYIDPGYNFRFDEGTRALNSAAAANGSLRSGQTLKDLTKYGQDAASQEYANAYGRMSNDRNYNRGVLTDDRNFGRSTYENDRNYGRSVYTDDRNFGQSQFQDARNFGYNADINNRDFQYGAQRDDRNFNYGAGIDARNFNYGASTADRAYNTDNDRWNRTFDRNNAVDDRNFNYGMDVGNRDFGYRAGVDDRNFNYGTIRDLVGLGQYGTSGTANGNNWLATLMSNNAVNSGQANAAGGIGGSNATANMISQYLGQYGSNQIIDSLRGGGR